MVYSKKAVVAYVNQICELCKAKIDYITQIQMSNATTKHQQMSEKPKYLVNLYNEQNLLVEMYKEQLSKFLKKILKISLEKMFCLPQVYFVYAKPFEEFQETESDTKIFLSTLAEHLDVAGISLVEFVNEKRILTGTQCEFSDALINGDFILTFGTRSFLARYKQGEINLASKFIFMMENCGPTTGKKQYVNLIVLNGQVESVFPTPFTRYSLITKHWRAKIDDGKGYVCYLATLIGYLYNVPTLLNREDLENDLRLLNRCIDKQAASDEKQTVGLKL